MKRGDVVIVDFPYVTGGAGKIRPAVIIQNDADNQRLSNTVIAMISGNLRHAGQPTQVLIDPAISEGSTSGLHVRSVVKCLSLYTVEQRDVLRVIGHLSPAIMQGINGCLRAALDIS